jgi:hypothetical protein
MRRLLVTMLVVVAATAFGTPAVAAPVTVTNATQFPDTGGNPVHAHGGGVLKVGSYYYWFGENRNANNTFRAVSAYRSTDLVSWEFRGDVLTQSSASELNVANIERPKVIYNASTGRYVMWMHKENGSDYGEARAAVASSATVDGAYTWHGSFRPLGHMSRDITLFNDNGTAYMISAANENYDLHIYRLSADHLSVAALVGNFWPGGHREAPAVFKRGSTYFVLTSGATGWNPNQARYATAPSMSGPWSGWTNTGDGTTFGSQPTFVLPIGNAFLYMGDRWAGAWGGPVNDSQYVWLPITFPSATSMSLNWYPQVTIDTAAGTVTGGGSTPYYRITARHSGKVIDVINGSTANNAEVKQWTYNGGANQKWAFQDAGGGYYRIVNSQSGRCLNVASSSTADGANVIQYSCGGGTNEQFQMVTVGSYFQLRARHSGKCLDVVSAGTGDGTDISQYTCNSASTNQQWSRTAS